MHFCADELFGLMMIIPFLGAFVHKIHAWYLRKFPKHGRVCHDHREPRECPAEIVETDEERHEQIAISNAESEGLEAPVHHKDKMYDELVRPEDLPWKFYSKNDKK